MLLYSGLDLVPESGELVMRRHDGREQTSPGFEFENYDQNAQNGGSSVQYTSTRVA